jgi:hypothetical protein
MFNCKTYACKAIIMQVNDELMISFFKIKIMKPKIIASKSL